MPTIAETLNAAVTLHQQGDLVQAERLYRQVLDADADNADAWHLLGLVQLARGGSGAALDHISRAIRLDGSEPSFHNHLAEAHRALGQWSQAEASCRRALTLKPDFAAAHNTLGTIHTAQGQFSEAASCYRQAIGYQPDFPQAHFNLGAALHSLGEHAEAADCYGRALAHDPRFAMAANNLGAVLADMGRVDEAIGAYRRALAINPQLAITLNNLGRILHSQSRHAEAADCFRRALAIEPGDAGAHCSLGAALAEVGQIHEAEQSFHRALDIDANLADAHFNLGTILQSRGRQAEAIDCYQKAIRAKPDCVPAHNNLGTLYKQQGRLTDAIGCYQRALEFQPDFAEVLNNLGNIFKLQGRIDEAVVCYDQTLRIRPDYLQARCNRALVRLAAGDLAGGWPDYEYRWAYPESPQRSFAQPQWTGEALDSRVLWVHAEQGLGDTLQFVRYLAQVAQAGGKVVFEVTESLVPLLTQSGFAEIAELVPKGRPPRAFDVHVPLLSLPGIFSTTLENIPSHVPYLSADAALVEGWREVLGNSDATARVGIAWQGSMTYQADRFRSIPLVRFAPLALHGVELVSLQKGVGREQLAGVAGRFAVRDLGDEFDRAHGAFMDAAAVIRSLDLVITSDTAIAHLAGGLGAEVWVALPLAADWRWLYERADSPWYPTMRLFRQSKFDDWSSVFARMADELGRRVAAGWPKVGR